VQSRQVDTCSQDDTASERLRNRAGGGSEALRAESDALRAESAALRAESEAPRAESEAPRAESRLRGASARGGVAARRGMCHHCAMPAVPLVARLHVDLQRVVSAACRPSI
jgi:hypothetical protein